jgi:hypothetical protein
MRSGFVSSKQPGMMKCPGYNPGLNSFTAKGQIENTVLLSFGN